MSAKNSGQRIKIFQRKYLCIPYAMFLVLFVIAPILIVLYYAFTDKTGHISLDGLISFFTSPSKANVLFVSFFIATQTTLLCLLIAYPLAYFLADRKVNKNIVLITLFVAPMWINFVLRTLATRDLLTWMGISGGKYPYLATMIGMVQNYLPFCILPLYTTMLNLDKNQMEAASDLGCSPVRVFTRSILPQSVPGIISAFSMTFMPTMSSYVISDTFSEGKITLFGNFINLEFVNKNWNEGSFMAFLMLIVIFIGVIINSKNEKQERGGLL